jgi:hypothetical protein
VIKYRVTLDYATKCSAKRHKPTYTVSSPLELFDRLCRIKAQSLLWLEIEYREQRWDGTWYRYNYGAMDDGDFSRDNRPEHWIDLSRWHDLDYREQIAMKCWEIMQAK